jgi:integrase
MNFYASLQAGRSHGTVHRYMRYLRALLFWLVERQVITGNPAASLRLPVVRQTRREMFCTREQRDHLLACAEGEGQRDIRFVLMAGFYLGLRINEIVNCRWGWFQGAGGLGHCVVSGEVDGFATKSRKSRTVPLHPVFQSYLQELKQGGMSDFVVRPEKVQGKQWLRWDPRVPFNAVCAAAGLEWVTPHVMRHTFGSLHAMAGTPEIKIRRWMGITQATLDRHYSGLSPGDPDASSI